MAVQIITGDAREVLPTLTPGSIDCIITDPPYGETSLAWDRWPTGWLQLALPTLEPHASVWVFGSQRMFMERAAEFFGAGLRIAQDLVWEKHNGSGLHNDRFRRVHEHAVQFYPAERDWAEIYKKPLFTDDATARTVRRKAKPAHWIGDVGATVYKSEDGGPRLMRSVMQVRSEHGRAIHPTQKPIGCILPLIEYSCPDGGTILDCFGGSGSVAVAARQLGRSCITIEVNSEFVAKAMARLDGDFLLRGADIIGHVA